MPKNTVIQPCPLKLCVITLGIVAACNWHAAFVFVCVSACVFERVCLHACVRVCVCARAYVCTLGYSCFGEATLFLFAFFHIVFFRTCRGAAGHGTKECLA